MSYYFIAQIKITNEQEYRKYTDRTDEVFKKFKGRYLAVDNQPQLLEGNWNYTRIVLITFESRGDFRDWYNSDEYQEILKHRLAGSQCDSLLVKGLM